MNRKITIINGPNLNLLGTREPDIYGSQTFDDYLAELRTTFPEVQIVAHQSNVEGEIVTLIQEHGFDSDIVLNAAAYSHTSIAIADAVQAVPARVVEVHISNIFARESERHSSLLSKACTGIIAGFGLHSYRLAIEYLLHCN